MKLMLHFFNPKKKEKELNVAFQNRPIKGFIKSVFFFFLNFLYVKSVFNRNIIMLKMFL